jgi:membrane protease subunit HflK
MTLANDAAVPPMLADNGPWGASGAPEDKRSDDRPAPPRRNPWDPSATTPPKTVRSGPSAADQLAARLGGIFGKGGGSGGGGGPMGSHRKSLLGYGAVGIVALWLALTAVHRIEPQERGVVTRFGRYETTLQPGVTVTLPAPIDRVRTIDVQNIRSVDIPAGAGEKLVLTRDENIINLDYSVRWSIKDPVKYLFELADPDQTIAQVAESAMRAAIANVDLNDAIGSGRTGVEAEVQARAQAILDSYRAGVRIDGVAIKSADPPEAVNDAFKEVSAAQQAAQTSINQANAYAQQITAKAQGEAAAFDRVYVQYKLAPEVTRRRMYYETMEDVLAKVDKTIVEPGVSPYMQLPSKRGPVPAPQVTNPGAAQ